MFVCFRPYRLVIALFFSFTIFQQVLSRILPMYPTLFIQCRIYYNILPIKIFVHLSRIFKLLSKFQTILQNRRYKETSAIYRREAQQTSYVTHIHKEISAIYRQVRILELTADITILTSTLSRRRRGQKLVFNMTQSRPKNTIRVEFWMFEDNDQNQVICNVLRLPTLLMNTCGDPYGMISRYCDNNWHLVCFTSQLTACFEEFITHEYCEETTMMSSIAYSFINNLMILFLSCKKLYWLDMDNFYGC